MNIYLQNETDFTHNGLGFLTDVLDVNVIDNLNGDYYLTFEYKLNGHLSEYLQNENIVKCKVADRSKQLFVIKNIIKTFDSIQVICKHIFYQLLDNFIEDTAPTNLNGQAFLQRILDKTNYQTNFIAYSDISSAKTARYVRRNPVDCILGDTDNSMVNLFGGELKRDNFNIYFNKRIGNDNGVKLIIGKNITGININIDTSSIHTRIMPQGYDGLFLPEKYVDSPLISSYNIPKIYKVEFSDIKYDPEDENAFSSLESAYEALRDAVQDLFDSGIDKPLINVKVDWIELSKTNEYKKYSNLEKVNLGDTVTIDLLGISYKARVIKTIYNPLTDRIDTFEIGTPKANIGTSTNNIQRQLEQINLTSILETARDNATKLLTQALGGYVYKTQNELFIMDTNDVTTAVKVWRWNLNGLGYSKNGINGPYETAITQDGQIVADLITAGKLNTSVIEGYDSIVTAVREVNDTITNQNQKISQVTQTVSEINSKISDIADITISGENNFGHVVLNDINTSEPITIKIHPINESISYLYPSPNLYPSETLYMKTRTLRFKNITTNEVIDYELPVDLWYVDDSHYDEFILEYDTQKCYVNKKVKINSDGTLSGLDSVSIVEYPCPQINLSDGDYEISLPGYSSAYLFVRLMAKNIYTTQFATRVEVNSSINQKANEIGLLLNQKLDNKDFSHAEIVLKLNDDTSIAKIKADRIDLNANDVINILAGNSINLTSNNIIMESTNFKLDSYGNATMNNVNITGGNITLTSTEQIPKFIIQDNFYENNKFKLSARTLEWTGTSGGRLYITNMLNSPIINLSASSGEKTNINSYYIETPELRQTSLETSKKNFEPFKDALDIIDGIDLYRYNLKYEENSHKKHIGFVIGKNYKYSSLITSVDENNNDVGVDLYSMASLCLQAIKELKEEVFKNA